MVDLSRDERDRVRTRLLGLVPGRSKKAYQDWLSERGEAFRQNVPGRRPRSVRRLQERDR